MRYMSTRSLFLHIRAAKIGHRCGVTACDSPQGTTTFAPARKTGADRSAASLEIPEDGCIHVVAFARTDRGPSPSLFSAAAAHAARIAVQRDRCGIPWSVEATP